MRRIFFLPIVFTLLVTGCAFQLPPLIPREILFGNPARTDPQISPNGNLLSYLAPDAKNVLQYGCAVYPDGTIGKSPTNRNAASATIPGRTTINMICAS